MRLGTKLKIRVRKGFLPHLANEIYKKDCAIKNISLFKYDSRSSGPRSGEMKLDASAAYDEFEIDIIYYDFSKYEDLLNKLSKHGDNFEILSAENPLKNELIGGLLDVSGKLQINNIIDYEMNALGAADLIINLMQKDEEGGKYNGISKNVGIFCAIPGSENFKENHQRLYALASRDSAIIKKFSGLNAFPLLVSTNQADDFIKVLQRLKETFSAIRIFTLGDAEEISGHERICSDLAPLPVLSQHFDEIPIYLLTVIFHLLNKYKMDIISSTAGIIGVNISSIRLTRILLSLGMRRVLGNDTNNKLLHNFEREGGLAVTLENIFNNSDIIITFKDQISENDLNKVGSGQLFISLTDAEFSLEIFRQRGAREILQKGWMDNSRLFPGILTGLIGSGFNHLDDGRIIKLSKKIFELKKPDEILPDIFSDIHKDMPDLINRL